MIELVPFSSLGRFENDWLSARYHFSFAEYFDPRRMGFGPLRVWNDDRIRPGNGFPMHGHRDMEIITYVRKGAVSHQDHLGNRGRTEAGDVQVMSAGKGIMHAEYNLENDDTELFQIWIEPAHKNVKPRWAARQFPKDARAGQLQVLASGRPEDRGGDALEIHQDAALLGATIAKGQQLSHALGLGRRAYLVVARGRVKIGDVEVGPRDGAAIQDLHEVVIQAQEESEVLLADLP
ncbi:MAG TPA: pirin family protein [Alphaproteobacteria bacterium]|jgi:redox-sensitive bicupin YhaK (pirin superfamily)|nr:pirin family protein [Alphaproteobacteria bacterium]